MCALSGPLLNGMAFRTLISRVGIGTGSISGSIDSGPVPGTHMGMAPPGTLGALLTGCSEGPCTWPRRAGTESQGCSGAQAGIKVSRFSSEKVTSPRFP